MSKNIRKKAPNLTRYFAKFNAFCFLFYDSVFAAEENAVGGAHGIAPAQVIQQISLQAGLLGHLGQVCPVEGAAEDGGEIFVGFIGVLIQNMEKGGKFLHIAVFGEDAFHTVDDRDSRDCRRLG